MQYLPVTGINFIDPYETKPTVALNVFSKGTCWKNLIVTVTVFRVEIIKE